jgi:hypothetical protein
MGALRRGRRTDEVFARAARATTHFHSFVPGTARDVESVEPISVEEARRMFDDHRRAKMVRRDDGAFVFVVGTPIGTTRVEIETREAHSSMTSTTRKKTAEYTRGFDLGVAAARDVTTRHGKVLGEFNARDLELAARRRGADAFDKGYAAGYRSVIGRST